MSVGFEDIFNGVWLDDDGEDVFGGVWLMPIPEPPPVDIPRPYRPRAVAQPSVYRQTAPPRPDYQPLAVPPPAESRRRNPGEVL